MSETTEHRVRRQTSRTRPVKVRVVCLDCPARSEWGSTEITHTDAPAGGAG